MNKIDSRKSSLVDFDFDMSFVETGIAFVNTATGKINDDGDAYLQ